MTLKKPSKTTFWISWCMSGLVILFMLMDSIFKFIQPQEVIDGTLELGYEQHHIIILGALGLISTILHIIPRTTMIGAILLTAYFGGAVATQIRLDNPLFSHILFTVYFGLFMWGGLWLRNPEIRTLIPIFKKEKPKK